MKLSICIPICNTDYPPAHYTGNCIGSIKYFTVEKDYEIIVIDNASTVELGGLIWDDVVDKYVKNPENKGVPTAWNQGIKQSSGDYIAILNSDIQVYENWDVYMMEALSHVQLVMATPMYDAPYGRALEAKKRELEWVDKSPDEYLSTFADFSCFMTTRDVFKRVGLFDEEYGLGYGEDIDFRLRMEKSGMVAKSDKRVAIHHVGMATGHTLGYQGVDIGESMNKNREYTQQKHDLDQYGVPGWKRDAQV